MYEWTDWRASAPPAPGVYNASRERNEGIRRYWDGQTWSLPWPEHELGGGEAQHLDPRGAALMEWRDMTPETMLWLLAEGVTLQRGRPGGETV